MDWLEKCIARKNHFAEYELAELLRIGKDVPTDQTRAQQLFSAALSGFLQMEQKSPDAQMEYRIGQMFLSGKGCAVDKAAAFQWILQSAVQNNAHAQFQVGQMLQDGDGVPKDDIRAGEFYTRAFHGFLKLNQEKPDSCLQHKIGTMLEFGLGVERDVSAAKGWYQMAANAGNDYAEERLSQISAVETGMAVNSVLGLFRALSQRMGDNIKDSTTHKYRQDRKLMQKQRELKAEHGHKYDDQEQAM